MIWLLTCKLWQVVKVPKTQTHTRITHAHMHARMHTLKEKGKKQSVQLPLSGHTNPAGHYSGTMSQCWQIHLGESFAGGAVPYPMVMVWALKVPPEPHPLAGMDSSLTFTFSVTTRYPLILQPSGLLSWSTPGPHLHIYSWVDCSNVNKSILLKETPKTPKCPHRESNPIPFNQKANALTA